MKRFTETQFVDFVNSQPDGRELKMHECMMDSDCGCLLIQFFRAQSDDWSLKNSCGFNTLGNGEGADSAVIESQGVRSMVRSITVDWPRNEPDNYKELRASKEWKELLATRTLFTENEDAHIDSILASLN